MDNLTLKVIARIYTDFGEKFGVPRQSGLVPELTGKIIFEPEYRVPEALSGIEGYSWLWLLWGFSESPRNKWAPTVRPPRLGGNKKAGVFATRSPFRPHPEGLGGFSGQFNDYRLKVSCASEFLMLFPSDKREALLGVLAQDPRPAYQNDPERVYGVNFAGRNVQFKVDGDRLTVCSVDGCTI